MINVPKAVLNSNQYYYLDGSGNRNIVRDQNGTLFAAARYSSSAFSLFSSKDEGKTWTLIATETTTASGLAMAIKDGDIHIVIIGSRQIVHYRFDENGKKKSDPYAIDTNQNSIKSLACTLDFQGNQLHVGWTSQNSTLVYANVRYAVGAINANGTMTWSIVEAVTTTNTSDAFGFFNLDIVLDNSGVPCILVETKGYSFESGSVTSTTNVQSILIIKKSTELISSSLLKSGWTAKSIDSNVSSNPLMSPSGIFVPGSVSKSAKGRIATTWVAKDSVDNGVFNVWSAFSDDGGITWILKTKHTSGNSANQSSATITGDIDGKLFIVWISNESTKKIKMAVFNSSWNTAEQLSALGHDSVKTILDRSFKTKFVQPPMLRTLSTEGLTFSSIFSSGSYVEPSSKSIGGISTKELFNYSVTPEEGSQVTKIVETVNDEEINVILNPSLLNRVATLPTVKWDQLKYFKENTLKIVVYDNFGLERVQKYPFTKTVSETVTINENLNAVKHGRERLATKQDEISALIKLPPGSTFDAIINMLKNGDVLKKVKVATASIPAGSPLVVRGLPFKPLLVVADTSSWRQVIYSNPSTPQLNTANDLMFGNAGTQSAPSVFYEDGFQILFNSSSSNAISASYIAIG